MTRWGPRGRRYLLRLRRAGAVPPDGVAIRRGVPLEVLEDGSLPKDVGEPLLQLGGGRQVPRAALSAVESST